MRRNSNHYCNYCCCGCWYGEEIDDDLDLDLDFDYDLRKIRNDGHAMIADLDLNFADDIGKEQKTEKTETENGH